LLVQRPQGLLLVDTGWGSLTIDDPRRFPGTLFALTAGAPRASHDESALGRVRALGMRADDVSDIVLTHLDIDHVGGLSDFPHATVHVAHAEHAARFERRQPFRSWVHDSRRAFAHRPRFALASWSDHQELGFPRSVDLFGDGSVILLDGKGHTPGHAAVLVRAGSSTLLHAGDSFVHHTELEGEEQLPFGVRLYRRVLHETKPEASATLDRVRRVRRAHPEVTLVNAHDASLLAQLPAFPAPVSS
jgi:glyoxylase-like metal-dependent hydrolase (beta-lactamase superfamily II)